MQNAFIKGRFILDGILIANETVEYIKRKKDKGLIFKVNFEKAYDSINWAFLSNMMRRMRFGGKWCKWIESCLKSFSMSILVNGSPTNEFRLERGARQGDPLSSFLFILAAEGLSDLVSEAVDKGGFWGARNSMSGNGVWRDIIKVGGEIDELGIGFTSSFECKVGNGMDISFWGDIWVGSSRLRDRFSRLCHLDRRKEGRVGENRRWGDNGWVWEWDWAREPT
ncbi:cysteine-rich receptor-like protein kinase [Tanacetum coccineum]